jgi:hypothetical protein
MSRRSASHEEHEDTKATKETNESILVIFVIFVVTPWRVRAAVARSRLRRDAATADKRRTQKSRAGEPARDGCDYTPYYL